MFYVYVIQSQVDRDFYTGYTSDLKKRLRLHNQGKVESTKRRIPMVLVYYEVCLHKEDALNREKYLKTTYGRRYIRNRLKRYLEDHQEGP